MTASPAADDRDETAGKSAALTAVLAVPLSPGKSRFTVLCGPYATSQPEHRVATRLTRSHGITTSRSTRSPKLRRLSQVFWRRTLDVPAPHLQTCCLTSHFGWHGRSSSVIGLRRSGWRRSVDHDRRSLRELGQNQADPRKTQLNHPAWRSEATPHWDSHRVQADRVLNLPAAIGTEPFPTRTR
jgi:hypothetical protein